MASSDPYLLSFLFMVTITAPTTANAATARTAGIFQSISYRLCPRIYPLLTCVPSSADAVAYIRVIYKDIRGAVAPMA